MKKLLVEEKLLRLGRGPRLRKKTAKGVPAVKRSA